MPGAPKKDQGELLKRSALRIVIFGAEGRMGRALLAQSILDDDFEVIAAIDRPGHPLLGQHITAGGPLLTDDLEGALGDAEVLIDFSNADALPRVVTAAADAGVPFVTGTTGLGIEAQTCLRTCSEKIPIVVAPNMSVGVNALLELLSIATRALGSAWDAEVFEIHHQHKRDAPSGTALELARAIARAREHDPTDVLRLVRSGNDALRSSNEVGIAALRGGDVVGEHTVFFFGEGERIELTHRASDRIIFVLGALRATRWVASQAAGFYTMRDVLLQDV